MAVENKFGRNKKEEDHEMANLQHYSVIGRGRAHSLFPNQSGKSGGRGKIKSLLQNLDDNKTILGNRVHSLDEVDKSGFPESPFSEKSESSSTKMNYFESKSDSKLSTSSALNQLDKDGSKNVIYSANEINKNTMSEELCFQLLKGKNKKSNTDPRNRKVKYLSQSHKLKARNYHDATFSAKDNFNQHQSDQISVNPSLLASTTFPSVNRISPMKPEPDELEYENNPPDSLVPNNVMNVDSNSKAGNNDSDIRRENSEFLFASPKPSSFSVDSSSILNSPVVNEEKSIRTDGHVIKSMGRGFLFNKFTESRRIEYDSFSKSESHKESKDYNDLKIDSKCENFQKTTNDYDNSAIESMPEVLKKSEDKPEVNDFEDNSDHEDRYFDIEEPTYLNCSKEFSSLDNKIETNQNVVKPDDERYEKILNLAPDNEHEPLDAKSFVTPAQAKPDGELLEQQILRYLTDVSLK